MKRIIALGIAMMLFVIMASVLKPREQGEEKQTQIVVNENMNVVVVSEENENQRVINQIKGKTVLELLKNLPEKYKETRLFKIKWTENQRNTGKELYCTQEVVACGPMGFGGCFDKIWGRGTPVEIRFKMYIVRDNDNSDMMKAMPTVIQFPNTLN